MKTWKDAVNKAARSRKLHRTEKHGSSGNPSVLPDMPHGRVKPGGSIEIPREVQSIINREPGQ